MANTETMLIKMPFNEIKAIAALLDAQEAMRWVLEGHANRVFERNQSELTTSKINGLCSNKSIFLVLSIYGLQRKFGASPEAMVQGIQEYGEDTLDLLTANLARSTLKTRSSSQANHAKIKAKSTTAIKWVKARGGKLFIPQIILTRLCAELMSPETCRTRLDLLCDAGLLFKRDGGKVGYEMTDDLMRYCEGYLEIIRSGICD